MNNITITGHLTRDPEARNTNSGNVLTRMTVAVKRPGTKNKTDFIAVTAFDREADFANKYFKKGSFIGVQGKLVTGSYTNKDGQTVYSVEIYADRLSFEGKSGKPEDKKSDDMPPGFAALEEDIPF